jgi:HD-GYP domain-containing protein (c-di-GMP phosphodiesterase class II)
VADAYDAMTTDRVYRSRLSHERAMAELERCAGTQFDPDVVAALVALMKEQETLRNIG